MKTCAFCLRPSEKLSGEHLWSKWIPKLFVPEGRGRYNVKTLNRDLTTYRHWRRQFVDLKAKVVCAECNNTWMSDLENRIAKPTMKEMIRYGAWVTLFPPGLASLAAFAFKSAVVADHLRPSSGKPFFSHSARRRFSQFLEVPLGVQIWLGSFYSPNVLSGRYTTFYIKIHAGKFKGFQLYVFTWVAGFLVVQLTASRWASIAKPPRFFPLLVQNPEWGAFSIPCWPDVTSPVVWPPVHPLTDDSLDEFSQRWKRLAEPNLIGNPLGV